MENEKAPPFGGAFFYAIGDSLKCKSQPHEVDFLVPRAGVEPARP